MVNRNAPQRTALLLRDYHGADAVEWFLFWAIATILITRLYLRMTGYPQIGGGQLHVAHSLWGGMLMIVALITGWLFLGSTPRLASILLGGIGFGLFLDEVGKFVTATNDYFYGPSAEIMYVVVVIVLFVARIVRDLKKPTEPEALANAAAIATDGVGHGLPSRLRSEAHAQLDRAADRGADAHVVEHIRGLINASKDTPDVLTRLRIAARKRVPRFLLRRWAVTVVGWALVVSSAALLAVWLIGQVSGAPRFEAIAQHFELGHGGPSTHILVVSGAATLLLSLPATIAFTGGSTAPWALRWLRLAGMVIAFSNALVDFTLEGSGALFDLGLGLLVLVVVSLHLAELAAEDGAGRRGSGTVNAAVRQGCASADPG